MRKILHHRDFWQWIMILAPAVFSVLMLLPLRNARINPNLDEYLPKNIQSKVDLEKLEAIFGKYDPVLVFIETDDILDPSTLQRIIRLSDAFSQSEKFDRVMSLSASKDIRSYEGTMLVEPVVREIPATRAEREKLRAAVRDNPLVFKLFVSEDFRYSIIMVNPVNISDQEAITIIQSTLEQIPGKEKTYLNGSVYMRYVVQQKATRDLLLLMPVGLVIMLLFLYLSFREWKGVMLPFAVVVMSIALALGLMPLMGYDLSLIAVLVPILMIAIANNYGVYIISRYQELNACKPKMSMTVIVNNAFDHLWKPILFTALTTIAGILGMVFTTMLPAKQMGIVCSVGIAFALMLSLFFIPSVLKKLKKGRPQKSFLVERNSIIDKLLEWTGRQATRHPLRVILVFALVLVAGGTGIVHLKVSVNNERMMPASHPLRISTELADNHFGGTKTISVLFSGDIMSPGLMGTMDHFEKQLLREPLVGNITSIATLVKAISRALHEPGDSLYNRIPGNRETIAQYIELFNMSGDPADLEQLVDFNYENATFNVRFSARSIGDFRKVEHEVRTLAATSPYCKLVAGNCLTEKEFAESIVNGQLASLVFALLAILVLVAIIFRTPVAGLLGSIPLVFSIIVNFGIMGWIGFKLDIANSMISSIAIGLGVDYTIHMFWRITHELGSGKDHKEAIRHTMRTTGRGIAINAFAVMAGFSVLFFSGIVLLQSFALLIILSLLMCLCCAIVLIPSILLLAKPSFLLRNHHTQYIES